MNSLGVVLAVIWTPAPDISAADAARFFSAIRGNDHALVASLLEQNPALLTVRRWGLLRESPLHAAVTNRNLSILTTLLLHCDQPTIFAYDGMTPLHHAALQNQTAHLKLLLQFGADPDPVIRLPHRRRGELIATSPLSLAAMRGSVDAVQTLLNHGADPNGVFPKAPHAPGTTSAGSASSLVSNFSFCPYRNSSFSRSFSISESTNVGM